MSTPNLADPDCEPTDEELIGLSQRAFAGLAAAQERATAKLRAEIAAARARALQRIEHHGPMRSAP